MSADQSEKPKIIVDDDWKTKVQAEKESLKKQEPKPEEPKVTPDESSHQAQQPIPEKLPPPSFAMLITTLAAQTMAALGQAPETDSEEPFVHLGLAKHYIDTLGMLDEKTKGNLSQHETAMLDNMLHELRMLYVTVSKRRPAETSQASHD